MRLPSLTLPRSYWIFAETKGEKMSATRSSRISSTSPSLSRPCAASCATAGFPVSSFLILILGTRAFVIGGDSAVGLSEPWPTAPADVGYLKLTRYDDIANGEIIKPSGKLFHGRVFVLIDASNSSATFQFAQNIQSHHLERSSASQPGVASEDSMAVLSSL